MITVLRFLHLLSLAVWLGGMVFLVVIGAPSIFKVLPRESAGDVLGDIFPKYWIMGYICGGTSLATIILLSFKERLYPWGKIGLLVLMTALTLYLGLAVASKAREVRLQIRTVVDTTSKETLKKEVNLLYMGSYCHRRRSGIPLQKCKHESAGWHAGFCSRGNDRRELLVIACACYRDVRRQRHPCVAPPFNRVFPRRHLP